MPVTNMEHAQSWTVTVVPSPGEPPWPLVTAPDGMSLEPDLILIWLQTGNPPVVKGSGRRVRRDETVGSLRVNAPWAVLDDLPDWARKLADAAMAEHGLGSMLPEHEIVPLPGSVRCRHGSALPGYEVNPEGTAPDEHPMTAMCSGCQEPVVRKAPAGDWEHVPGGPQ